MTVGLVSWFEGFWETFYYDPYNPNVWWNSSSFDVDLGDPITVYAEATLNQVATLFSEKGGYFDVACGVFTYQTTDPATGKITNYDQSWPIAPSGPVLLNTWVVPSILAQNVTQVTFGFYTGSSLIASLAGTYKIIEQL
jgi:hypothetical protein